MADITKGLFLLIILAVVIGVGIGAWEHFTDPRIQAHRDFQFDLQEQSQARLQPVLDTAKEITIYISLLFLAGIASEIVLVLHERRQRMYPLGGLYQARVINPSLFQRAVAFLRREPAPQVKILPAPNEARAQVGRATIGALQPGARLNSPVMRALLTAGEVIPTDEQPALDVPLPTTISAYSAPLPQEPALLLGNLGDRDLWFPLGRSSGHILCAASPGSGKTNWLQAAFVNATRYDPRGEHIRFAITDLKEMDFALIPDMQALAYPVAYQPEDGLNLLEKLEAERIRRADLISSAGYVALEEYNASHPQQALPYLVAMFDEISGFMLHPDREIGMEFARMAQKVAERGPASGMHLILCTQRVSSKVIPGNISGICDTRLAFGVATDLESRMIIGQNGAEALPPVRGRFMYRYQREIGTGQAYYASARDGRFLAHCQRLPRRLALESAAGAAGRGSDDLPDGVAPGVTGAVGSVIERPGSVTGNPPGVIDGEFRSVQSVITPQSHSDGPQNDDLVALARDLLPVTLDADSALDQRQTDLIWRAFVASLDTSTGKPIYSVRQTQLSLWPENEPGGEKARLVKRIVLAEAQRRGLNIRVLVGVGTSVVGRNGRLVKINGGTH